MIIHRKLKIRKEICKRHKKKKPYRLFNYSTLTFFLTIHFREIIKILETLSFI